MTIRKSKFIDEPAVCPKCQDNSILEYSYADTVDFRNLELDVENLVGFCCKACNFKWETPTQIELNQAKLKEEYVIARDKLRGRYGLLTGDKIAEVRKKLTITQREAAVLFGGGSNAFNKYESGEVLQSFAMDRLIRLTGAIGESAVEFLKDVDAPIILSSQVLFSTQYILNTPLPLSYNDTFEKPIGSNYWEQQIVEKQLTNNDYTVYSNSMNAFSFNEKIIFTKTEDLYEAA